MYDRELNAKVAAKQAGQVQQFGANQEAMRETEIEGELRRLLDAQHAVREAVSMLCARLAPVQRVGAGAIKGDPANAPMPTLCPVANVLRTIRLELEATLDMLTANCEQLEI